MNKRIYRIVLTSITAGCILLGIVRNLDTHNRSGILSFLEPEYMWGYDDRDGRYERDSDGAQEHHPDPHSEHRRHGGFSGGRSDDGRGHGGFSEEQGFGHGRHHDNPPVSDREQDPKYDDRLDRKDDDRFDQDSDDRFEQDDD